MRSSRLAVLALVLAVPAQAQVRLSFAPQIGFYIPTEKLQNALVTGNTAELEAGPSFGARIGATFGNHLGVSFSGNYVPTTFKQGTGTASNTFVKQDAKLFTGAGQLVVFILPVTSPLTLYVNGGVGVISRGGVAFTSASKTNNISGVFGAGAGIRLGPIGLNVGADLYTYNAEYAGTNLTTESLKQKDVHLKFGLGVPFGAAARPASSLRAK
ncbi:MAG: outer membrane beta-barrel protein [Gemmatimonadota bacterium]